MAIRLTHRRITPAEVIFPQILQVAEYMEQKRGDRPFASRRDILPEEISFALGRIMIMDIRYEPLDFIYRLYGSEISAGDHDEVTKRSVYDQKAGPYRDILLACYTDALANRAPTYHEMTIGDNRRSARYQRGLFPLSDDQQVINMLLSVTWWNNDLNKIWNDFLQQG